MCLYVFLYYLADSLRLQIFRLTNANLELKKPREGKIEVTLRKYYFCLVSEKDERKNMKKYGIENILFPCVSSSYLIFSCKENPTYKGHALCFWGASVE